MDDHLARGIELFNTRQFFLCHEVLEEVWTDERGPRRQFLQALIHFAVGFHHHQHGNPVGAGRQLRKGLSKIAPHLPRCEEIDTARLAREILATLERIETGVAEVDYPLIHAHRTSAGDSL
jgi:predicted metal-dependent hydrolase